MQLKSKNTYLAAGALGLAMIIGYAGATFADSGEPQQEDAGAAAPAGGADLTSATDTDLGEILVTGDGHTVYMFDDDTADPPASNCNGDCAEAWPPVEYDAGMTYDGSGELGTVTREDGTEQATVNGWPLYTYAEDAGPGDVNGEGANDVWWVLSHDGGKAHESGGGDGQTQLTITGHPELGEIVVDKDGKTLYIFDEDTTDPPASNCNGDCAEAWPPLEHSGSVTYNGDESLVGSVTRDDGTEQVTLNGWPLYTYVEDEAAGEATGEAVNDVWWAVSPLGTKANEEGWTEGYCPAGFDVRVDPQLGEILVDDQGFTLYLWDEDSNDPPASNCNGDCAEAWPPVLDMANFEFNGVDESKVGAVTRDAGLDQITVNGWPVYRYAEDTAAGDINGHGVNNWWAVTPDGERANGGQPIDGGGDAGGDYDDADAGGDDAGGDDSGGGGGYGY